MGYQRLVITATTPELPAPYAFESKILLELTEENPAIDFSIRYIDRDRLTLEEIYDEGFTESDDFSWKGIIGKNWVPVIEETLQKTTLRKTKTPVVGNPMHILIVSEHTMEGADKSGVPSEYEMWEFLIEELTQAVYESGKKENPLEIFARKIEMGKAYDVIIKGSFQYREASIAINSDKQTSLEWSVLKNYMKVLFQADYLGELALAKSPKRNGIFISMDEKEWYEMGVAIVEPTKKSQALARLKEWLNQLLGH